MSSHVVGGFAPILRDVEAGLTLPIPERVRILRELEWDLCFDLTDRFGYPLGLNLMSRELLLELLHLCE